MELEGTVMEHGTTRRELKDGTEHIYTLKVGEKGSFGLTIKSWDKELINKIKQSGEFEFDPLETEVTVQIQCRKRKEKYDKEDENVLPYTGNPWITLKRTFAADEIAGIADMLGDTVIIKFA